MKFAAVEKKYMIAADKITFLESELRKTKKSESNARAKLSKDCKDCKKCKTEVTHLKKLQIELKAKFLEATKALATETERRKAIENDLAEKEKQHKESILKHESEFVVKIEALETSLAQKTNALKSAEEQTKKIGPQ
jgi:chromosome segregation ATPase